MNQSVLASLPVFIYFNIFCASTVCSGPVSWELLEGSDWVLFNTEPLAVY